jgi:hypothetical protein
MDSSRCSITVLTRHGIARNAARAETGPTDLNGFRTVHPSVSPLFHLKTLLTMSSESPSGQERASSNGLRDRIKKKLMSHDNTARIRNRRKALALAWRYVNVLRCVTLLSPRCVVVSPKYRLALLAAGYFWLFALPLSQLGVGTYIDENALQPSQVPLSTSIYSFPAGQLCSFIGQHLLELGRRSSRR